MNFDVSQTWAKINLIVNGFFAMLPNLVLALVLFTISWVVARWAKTFIVGFYGRRGRHQNLGLVLGRVAQAGLILLNLMIALSIVLPSFSGRDLIQILGISSVAIGFAFRDILQNFLAGILILLAEPFRIGDEIAVAGLTGVVQEIQARATILKTGDGFLVVIPNSDIYTQKVTIYNAYDTKRTSFDFVVGFRDDLEAARRLVVGAVKGIDGVLDGPAPSCICTGVADNGVKLRARWWTDSRKTDDTGVLDRAIAAVNRTLLENGVEIAYPTRQVLFHDQTEETDGDRRRQRAGWPAGRGDVPRPRRLADALSRLAEASSEANGKGRAPAPSPAAEERG